MVQQVTYVAKHAFTGNVAQSQISFPQGARLTAKAGQEGNAWWWGSYNGREGWFPPAYVTAVPAQQPYASPQMTMQQRWHRPPSHRLCQQSPQPLRQQPYAAQGSSNGALPQAVGYPQQGYGNQGAATTSFGSLPPAPEDPFAHLDNMSAGPPAPAFGSQSPAMTSHRSGVPPPPPPINTASAPNSRTTTPRGVTPKATTPRATTPRGTTPRSTASSSGDSAAAALARMGVSPARTVSPKTNAPGTPRSVTPTARSSPLPPSAAQKQAAVRGTIEAATAPTASQPRRPMTKEEMDAKRQRDREEAQMKAQMRREKEEIARAQKAHANGSVGNSVGGIGASGVTISASGSGEVEVGLAMGAPSVHNPEGMFNPFEFVSGGSNYPNRRFSPIYRTPPFWALLGVDSYVRKYPSQKKMENVSMMYEQLSRALSFVCHVMVETENLARSGRGRFALGRTNNTRTGETPVSFLRMNHLACEACIKLISILPHSAGASGQNLDQLFLNFINVFVSLIENVQPNQQLVVPGGWQQPDYAHLCLYVVRNCGDNRYSFTVCNTGPDGLQYHPSSFDPETGRQLKQLAMTIWNIPSQRLLDSTFWVLLFRMQVYPNKKNDAKFLYTKLLPALNAQPLLSNLDQGPHEFLEPPSKIASLSYHPVAQLALTTTPSRGARPSKYSSLFVMNAAVDLAYAEIENLPPSSMDPEDTRILKLTGRNLANYASTIDPLKIEDGTLTASLSNTWDLLDKLLKKLNFASSKPMDQHSHGLSATALSDSFAKGVITTLRTEAGSAAHPLFGRLRRDDYENVVKRLMGEPRPDPILIPAVLTDEHLPPVATNFQEASSSLQRIADACSLLLQQKRLVKNAAAFAASAAQYALTTVLPHPNLDPKFCFWRKNPMRRETQVNLLFLIRRICRIYAAATVAVQQSRGLIAIRATAFACAAIVADAICRVKAVDDPSQFALHYSGLCEGPTEPFGIEAGAFEGLASNLPIYDPNICSIRFQCLEYLRGLSLKNDGSKVFTIFNFDVSQKPTPGDCELIDQLSIQLALVRPYPATKEAKSNHAASLITGRNGAIIEIVPEFEYFRDIVFFFKHSVSGKAQTAPVEQGKRAPTWFPSDAILRWDLKRGAEAKEDPYFYYDVKAFRGHPQEFVERVAVVQTPTKQFQGFLSLFSGKTRVERARLSSADPTTVVNMCGDKFQNKRVKPIPVDTEDDVLHLTKEELPSFGNVLTPSDSERLVQFLTVPYLRIPLIMDFFANGDPTRLTALRTKSLQLIVDACLFEPGNWKPPDFTDGVNEIPVVDRDRLAKLLATPHGTLFNEIAKSPDVLTSCVIKILERALDMDVGKYTKVASSGPLILYSIRLGVRIEGYLKYALKKCVPGQPRPRGLESLDVLKVEKALKKIRNLLDSQAIPTLEYWIDPNRNKDVGVGNLVHAHLLYLFKNYDYEDLDFRAVSIILSSQVYLTINHRFSTNVYDDLQDTPNPTHPPPSIQIAQSEVFDVIQSHRYNILRFARENTKEGDHAMEAVVRIATGTGDREGKDDDLKERQWSSIGHHTCYGRMIPDTEEEGLRDGSYRIPKPGQTFEEWMLYVTSKAVGIEVNLQLSDFTLQNHKMTLLDEHIMEDPDFKSTRHTALRDASDVACAEVMHTTNRYWWRLVGRRYDVQSWSPDSRNYYDIKGFRNPEFSRKFPNNLRPGEKWISDALHEKLSLILPGVNLYLSKKDFSDEPFALLAGWIENPRNADTLFTHTLKEVVVWQNPPVINVYNVVEHGRRHMRILEYTSNMSMCLHEVNGEPYPDRVGGILSLSGGIPMTTLSPEPSLIITRALNAELGTQTLIPDRFLAGLLPTCLVEKYTFWQSEDDNLIGYETEDPNEDKDEDDGTDKPSTRLEIKLAKTDEFDASGFCNSAAEAKIQRFPVMSNSHDAELDPNRKRMTLLNVLSAPPSSLLKRIAMLLSRLDNLSQVLVWSYADVPTAHSAASIDLIELPRVNLSFKAKQMEGTDGKTEHHLYSNDHDGLYIATSTEAREIAERLLGSISHFIVLQNAENDLFVLMPGCALPRRLHTDGSRLSVQVMLDRRNQEWIDNIGEVRCYLYPVHTSRSFVVTPSLASSMYLMVMYFITGSYPNVYKMVESCVSEELSAEEKQIFDQLEFLGNDFHPDAHACRLKLSVVTVGLGGDDSMRCPWSVTEEMEGYCKKHPFVSSACRLTTEEELLLLQLCAPSARDRLSLTLLNRKAYVTAVSSLANLPADKSLTVKLGTEKMPKFENFDLGEDNTIITNPKKTMLSSKLFGAAYSRPEEDQVAYGGLRALEYINNALSSGVEIASSRYGFPLLYDLLTSTVGFKLHPNDRPHNWGRMLFRLLPPGDFKTKCAEMSVLRLLAENLTIASHPNIPKFQIDSGLAKFKGVIGGKDAVSRLLEQLGQFFKQEGVQKMVMTFRLLEECEPRSTMVLNRPENYSQHRLWVVPRITDYSQARFFLDVQNCASVNIPLKQLQAFASKPLAPMKLEKYVEYMTRSQVGLPQVSGVLPFNISSERSTQTHCSQATLQRVTDDVHQYAQKTNTERKPTLLGFTPREVDGFHDNPGALSKALGLLSALGKSLNQAMTFDRKSLWNLMNRALAIATSDERSDTPNAGGPHGETNFLRFRLGQASEREPSVWFELLVASILSTTAEHDIRSLNPYMSSTAYKTVTSLTVVAMLTSIRIGQTHRALTSLSKLMGLMRRVKVSNQQNERMRICQEIKLQSSKVATDITNERHFMKVDPANPAFIEFDPRYLVFEFTYSIMLRKSQVILVNKFMDALRNNRSMCHQMIMGAGKTTVVTPLLALMLADGKSLVTQVVPHALLEFSRGVMREKFAAVVRKPVFTFTFSRGTPITRELYLKLCKARDSKAVICATPTSVKSFMLKFVEMMRHLEEEKLGSARRRARNDKWFSISAIARRFREQSIVQELRVNPEDLYYCTEILKLFRSGVLLLDEVDLLLHPLKSELNWPIGIKDPIDYSRSRLGVGLRWEIQWHLIDAIFYASTKKMSVAFKDSREAITILDSIAAAIQVGLSNKYMQSTPHLVLLNKPWYHKELKHLMARWQLLYLRNKRLPSVDDKHLLSYMVNGPKKDQQAASAVSVALDDEYMKMLNLSHDLLKNFLPFMMGKINRVTFGLLSKQDLKQADDENISLTRRLCAIPFVGKDVPSRASQFSHPDVVIGLTTFAYRYEGLRLTDFQNVLLELREQLDSEFGPIIRDHQL